MEEVDELFIIFYDAGLRKCNKQKAKASFKKVIKSKKNKQEFLNFLIADIHSRLVCVQLGFAEMHPTTYLNGARWEDERQDLLPF